MELSVMSPVLAQMSLEDSLAYLSSLGVDSMEIGAGGYPGKAHLDPKDYLGKPEKIEELKNLFKKYNMKVSAVACHGNPVHPNKEIAKKFHEDFVDAMKVAYANRSEKAVKVGKEAKAGIAMVSNLAYNYGNPQTDISVDVAGVLVEGGKVVASEIDAIVYPLSISALGKITPNTSKYYFQNGQLTSKNTLGDKYAMAERNNGQAGCTLEWYEQAEVIEAAALNKTSTEIATLKGKEGELATATITLNNYVAALAKAAKYAEMEHVGPQW